MPNLDLEIEQSSDSPGTSPTLSSVCCSALALAPSSRGHSQGEQLCPQVSCWEALALCPSPAQCQTLPKPGQHLGAGSACLASLAWSGVAWFGTHALILDADPHLHLPYGFAWLGECRPQIPLLASGSDLFLFLPQCPDNVMDLPGQPSTRP